MPITYLPINVEKLALVAIYQGIGANGKAEFELVDEPIAAWQIEVDQDETIVRPLIAGYQRTQSKTIRIAIWNYDGSITWSGRQFENLNDFLADFGSMVIVLEKADRA